jgi:hypothetical protein
LAHSVFSASGSLRLLSEALCRPDVKARAVLRCCLVPNALRNEGLVQARLACDWPADAIAWRGGYCVNCDATRQRLLAQTSGQQRCVRERVEFRR